MPQHHFIRPFRRILVAALLFGAAFAASATRAQESRFDVLEFEIEGNTVLPALAIERAVYPFLGPGKTIDDVQGARAALEKAYQDAGYLTVVVDVPPQQVKGGKVVLAVTEATVEKLAVAGNRYRSRDAIRERFPSLAPGAVPYFPDAQKELAAFNRVPGRSATPVLKPGTQKGTVGMELKIQEDKPFAGSIELNNRQAINTEPLRLSGTLKYNNLWGRDHSASLLYLTSPEDTTQVRALSGNYILRLPDSGQILAFYAVRSRSTVATLGSSTVVGNGNIYGFRGILPLPGDEVFSHNLVYGADYKESFQGVGIDPTSRIEGTLTYLPFTAQYGMAKTGLKGTTRASIQTSFLTRSALLGNRDDEFARRRFRATANYAVLRAEVSRQQTLPKNFTAFLKLTAHTSSQPLVNTEQFIAAGADGVRGYYEAEVVGDDGWMATAELRSPSLIDAGEGAGARELIAVGFVDAANVRLKRPLPGETSQKSPWSVGLGLRFRAQSSLSATLEVGLPMEDVRRSTSDPGTEKRDPRLHLRVAYDF
jgi:hemolysin activation/secretion protein